MEKLWGTDATRLCTKEDGWCWFFVAVAHCVTDVVGWHVAKKGDRWAALEPIRQRVRTHEECLYLHDFESLEEAKAGDRRRSSNATTEGGSWSGTGIGPRPRSGRSSP